MSPLKKSDGAKKYHPLRVPKELEARLMARAKPFKSVNAYILHAIEVEIAHAEACKNCVDRAIAESVRETVRLAQGSG